MKKAIFVFIISLFLFGGFSACKTAEGTIVRGAEIRVLYSQEYVRQLLGNPDETTGDSWTYKSTKPGEPDTMIFWGAGGVANVVQSDPK